MLRLVEADRMTAPIWKSPYLTTDEELAACLKAIKDLVPKEGYQLRNPLKITQLEVLDDDLEQAFRKLINRYQELTGEDLNKLRYEF